MPLSRSRRRILDQQALAEGWHSGLEQQIGDQLKAKGIPLQYETVEIPFVRKAASYKPDFILPNGIIVETKGWFQSHERSKHLLIKQQHPDLDIRFVFTRSKSKIGKKSETTYAKWCVSKGFKYADLYIPSDWLSEPANTLSLAAIARLQETKKK